MKKQYLVPEFIAKEIEESKVLLSAGDVAPVYNQDVEIDVSETNK